MKHWNQGIIWGAIQVASGTTNDPGTTKYWLDGVFYGDIFPMTPAATTFVARVMWFN